MSLKPLIKELDRVFSIYIRLRDTGEDGFGQCISCHSYLPYKKANAGHYISRNVYSIRWSEVNVNFQCVHCNFHLEGNNTGYREGILKKYGQKTLNELELARHKEAELSRFELTTLIKFYRSESKKLLKDKNFTIKKI